MGLLKKLDDPEEEPQVVNAAASVEGRCEVNRKHGDRVMQCVHVHKEDCGDGSDCHSCPETVR